MCVCVRKTRREKDNEEKEYENKDSLRDLVRYKINNEVKEREEANTTKDTG